MSRQDLIQQDLFSQIPTEIGEFDFWGNLNRHIRNEQIVPIISNSIINNHILDIDEDGQLGVNRSVDQIHEKYHLMIDEQLAKQWADFIKYPLAENPLQLSQVAQYNQVISDSTDEAKINYLTFLKVYLLQLSLRDEEARETARSLVDPLLDKEKGGLKKFSEIVDLLVDQSFSEIAFQLGYPKYGYEQQNPLYLLAQLPLPVYVTTSHHDFLARVLVEAEKYPRIQVCSWFGDHPEIEWFGDPPEDMDVDINADPSERLPIVYHLHGLEKFPTTLVTSEDDYMEFLVKISEDKNNLPLGLRKALGPSSLLLLGYRLRGWDFRSLFRGIIIKYSKLRRTNFAIQLNPPVHQTGNGQQEPNYLQEAQQYLEQYFEPAKFKVRWDSSTNFMHELMQQWKESTK